MKQDSINQIIEELKIIEKGTTEQYDNWYRIFRMAIQGMNYGEGDFHNTGEQNVIRRVKEKAANKKAVLFDVGANIGGYTSSLLQAFSDADFEIHAFEPSKVTFETLENNVNDKRVILNRVGLSNENKEAVLYSNKDGSGLASLYDRQLDYYGVKLEQREKVPLDTLDNYCRKRHIEKIDFMKIDVEGNEINVLRGGGIMLPKKEYRHCSLNLVAAILILERISGIFGTCLRRTICCLRYVGMVCIE